MHVYWKNCPVAWQGAFDGKEKKPTIVLEGGCDYNTWFWHVKFGFPGSMNDIDIWNRSELHAMLEDGTFASDVDPTEDYFIGGHPYRKLWFMVEGRFHPP